MRSSPMVCEIQNNGDTTVIYLDGHFVFDGRICFRDAYDQCLARNETRLILLDMAKVSRMDSSALGMLLLLKERAEAVNKTVHIRGASGLPRSLLEVAQFHRIFTIL
jgi:anti-anti-sigma factor